MSSILTSIAPIWKVLIVGLLAGAGLPAIFALGLRFLSSGSNGDSGAGEVATAPAPLAGKIGAAVCFAVVALVVAAGLFVMTAPKTLLAHFGLS